MINKISRKYLTFRQIQQMFDANGELENCVDADEWSFTNDQQELIVSAIKEQVSGEKWQ